MDQVLLSGFCDELEKISGVGGRLARWLHGRADPVEVGGLGILAAPSIDSIIARVRARRNRPEGTTGEPTEQAIESKRLIKKTWHDPIEVGGLAALALPSIGAMVKR